MVNIYVHYSRETMYTSFQYFTCNCKPINFHIVYFYTIPERMFTEQDCQLRMVIVYLSYTIPERLCTNRLNISVVIINKSIFIELYFYTIPERMCTEQNC